MSSNKMPKRNPFMIFVFEWREKNAKHMNLANATNAAGKIWTKMTEAEKKPYVEKAKQEKVAASVSKDKLTCVGTPLSLIEKEKMEEEQKVRSMKSHIERIIRDSMKRNQFSAQKFYVIMVNYFAKTLQGGVYIPAEIAICVYSLKEGVCNMFHSFINPGIIIYGHMYEAQTHADNTHKLPLPPNAMGESDLGKLYNSILHFIRPNDDGEYPPLFTSRYCLPIVESSLSFLQTDPGANNVSLKVYPMQQLFYSLKMACCEIGEVEKPASPFITDAYFDRDTFEYMVGIACDFHEKQDKSNYCPQSCVTRWCYIFSDYMCADIAITCIPGRHLPINTKIQPPKTLKQEERSDTESVASMASESTYATNPLPEYKMYYDDQKSTVSSRRAMFNKDDFPDLTRGSHSKARERPKEFDAYLDKEDDETEVNHWAGRSRKVPPKPDNSHFKIDVSLANNRTNNDLNDADDLSSVTSFGRGRLLKGGFGRGNSLYK